MSRSLTSYLSNTENLLANLKDLPTSLQNKALLWLKKNLPPMLSKEEETKDEVEEELHQFDMRKIESNILKIQKAYDPGEFDSDTLFVKEEEEAAEEVSPSSLRATEGILKVQEAYDPQDCKDVTPSRDEEKEKEGSSASKEGSKDWGIMKMLEPYVPKISTLQGLLEKKHTSSSLEKEEEDIPGQEEEEEVSPSRDDILKLLRAYEPMDCEDITPSREAEEEAPTATPATSGHSEWSLFKLVQSYLPKSVKDSDSSKEEEDK
ncbi:hypothetical protein E2320_000003 [Naja naja]|nr:hypothetical protein E2320_000003 [Naja naja]